jgi:hypothetical protein
VGYSWAIAPGAGESAPVAGPPLRTELRLTRSPGPAGQAIEHGPGGVGPRPRLLTADTHTPTVCRVLPEVRCPSASTKSPRPRRPGATGSPSPSSPPTSTSPPAPCGDMTADGRLRGYRLNRGFVRYDLNEVDAALQPFGGCASPTTPTNTATPSPSPTAHRLAGTQLHPSHGGTEHSRSHRPTQDPNTDPGVCRHET